MANEKFDAIIVGARAAGASMAAFLSRAGFRVLLTDRVIFPKTTLSCPLIFGNTLDLLNRIGVLPNVEALGAPKLRLYQTHIRDIQLRGRMLPYNGFDYTYQIRRERFDQAVFEHVAALPNVETRLSFTITNLIWENDRVVGVRGRGSGGAEEGIRAEIVVGADGVFSTVADQVRAKKYNVIPPRTCVYYAYYSNVAPAANEPTATIYYDLDAHFAFITADSESNLTVVSISLPAALFERVRNNHGTIHFEYAAKIPEMAERMKNAKRETPIYSVSPRESFYRVPSGAGWVLVGDAGFYKDPLPGQGIHDALRSSEIASNAFIDYRANGSTPQAWERAFKQYRDRRDRETRAMYALTDYYAHLDRNRTPQELALFRAIAAMPEWSNRYVSLFNGMTDAAWFRRFPTPLRIIAEYQWQQFREKFKLPLSQKLHSTQ